MDCLLERKFRNVLLPIKSFAGISVSLPSSFVDIVRGKRVLFINAIRSDLSSGGNTATQTLLRLWSPVCNLKLISLAPDRSKESLLAYVVKSFPAPIFILLYRHFHHIWLEFFARFSPWFLLSSLISYWRFKPDIVVFNHHSSFCYAYFFQGSSRVFVWHDVPSFKRNISLKTSENIDARICASIERVLLKQANYSLVLSFADQRALRRLYQVQSWIFPVLDYQPQPRVKLSNPNTWLLIGNWDRIENCDGAIEFFRTYSDIANQINAKDLGHFLIAGNGSVNFLQELLRSNPQIKSLEINAVPRYENVAQFSAQSLIAPILEGAGIKLKTLEAWSCGVPVIGTTQAFSGLSSSVWRLGGLRVTSISELAKLCLDWDKTGQQLDALDPISAYQQYLKAVGAPSTSKV